MHLSYLNNIWKITFFVESIFSIFPNVDVMPAITSSMRPIHDVDAINAQEPLIRGEGWHLGRRFTGWAFDESPLTGSDEFPNGVLVHGRLPHPSDCVGLLHLPHHLEGAVSKRPVPQQRYDPQVTCLAVKAGVELKRNKNKLTLHLKSIDTKRKKAI